MATDNDDGPYDAQYNLASVNKKSWSQTLIESFDQEPMMKTPNQTQDYLPLMSASIQVLMGFWINFLDKMLKSIGRDLLKGRHWGVLHQSTWNRNQMIFFYGNNEDKMGITNNK